MKMRSRMEENERETNKTLRKGFCPRKSRKKEIVVMCFGVNE